MDADRSHRRVSSTVMQPPSIGFRSRRGSLASISSKGGPLDKEALAQALDEIHTTASRQETLTSFSDYDGGSGPKAGPKELVSGGLAGLYTRFKQTVTGGSPEPVRPGSAGSHGNMSVISALSAPPRPPKPDFGDLKRASSVSKHTRELSGSTAPPRSPRPEKDKGLQELLTSAVTTSAGSQPAYMTSPLANRRSTLLNDCSTDPSSDSRDASKERGGSPARSTFQALSKHAPSPEPSSESLARKSRIADGRIHSVSSPSHRKDATLAGDEDHDKANRDASQASSKRLSTQSKHSLGSPPLKADPKAARQLRAEANSVESLRNATVASPPLPPVALTRSDPPTLTISQPKPLARLTEKGLPTVNLSRAVSAVDGAELTLRPSSAVSSNATTPRVEFPPNLNSGFRRPQHKLMEHHRSHTIVPAHLKRRVVSKEFWMKDENARDCFYCGDTFSTFRRKHHCRTCGQIFDAKCTTLVSGRPFDLPGTLRLCRPCEGVIYGSDDDSTVFTDDDEDKRASVMLDGKLSPDHTDLLPDANDVFKPDDPVIATPSIGIPASRRNRESKRRSAVIEFDANPILARPGSSRSLKSLANRQRSSSHRRYPSKHQYMKSIRQIMEERGPFHQEGVDADNRQALPAFHNDNIIDPDLAPFMSDQDSSDDQASIFTVLNTNSHPSSFIDTDQPGFAAMGRSSSKKGRSRAHSDRLKESDVPRPPTRGGAKLRKRNASIASINFARPSPRRSRSQNFLLRDTFDSGPRIDGGSDGASIHESLVRETLEGKIKRSAAMHGRDAPSVELNRASLQHVRELLSQQLHDNNVPNANAWQKALMPILLQCTDDVEPDVQHGDDMDVRNYIKLKKVPGGRPGDTAYVSGVVFSRNVSLKGMKRSFIQPRLVIVTFPIEYARHNNHFMSLEPILAQEREYLRNLVGRIVALRPQVLLVQKNVSGIALQMLHQADITVVTNVKESVLAAVARVTRTIMIKTVDKLSIDPAHLGQCENFDVKTYVHGGAKRTYIFISGCQANLGCTIVLRGATTDALRQVKRVTEFMCYVVYNLKLETCLMRDEFVLMPSPAKEQLDDGSVLRMSFSKTGKPEIILNDGQGVSTPQSFVDEQQPVLLAAQQQARQGIDDKDTSTDNADVTPPENQMPSHYRELVKSSQTRLMSSSPFVKFNEPYLLSQVLQQEISVEKQKRLLDRFKTCRRQKEESGADLDNEETDFEMVQADMLQDVDPARLSASMYKCLHDVFSTQYQKAMMDYSSKKKQWESFFEGNDRNPFDPYLHQNIFVLQSLVSSVTHAPCAGPEVLGLAFYADYEVEEMNYQDDCTLGQFVEDICVGASTPCKTCNRNMVDHHRQYVHGNGQLTVSVTRYPARIKGLHNSILMWSSCKICNQETPVVPMSDNTWKYSFGKYLELSFWSTQLRPRAGICPHDIHKDFVRCFGFHDYRVRVQYDAIEIYDVIVPNPIINWAIDADLTLKNKLYSECVNKLSAFIASVKSRLGSINLSTVSPEKAGDASAMLEKLVQKADHDQAEILNKIQSKYMSSRYYEVVPLNRAIRFMDEKAIAWDEAFGDFERNYFPSETDIRHLAALQLKKIFLDRNEQTSGEDMDSVEMKDASELRKVKLPEDLLQYEKTQNMMNSVLEEQIGGEKLQDIQQSPSPSPFLRQSADGDVRATNMIISEPEKAVERPDVKHLDLALPSTSVDHTSEGTTTESIARGTGPDDVSLDAQDLPEPEPLAPTLVEKIEQIRAAAASEDNGDESKTLESRIPRPTENRGKSASLTPAPLLIRAQTQPANIPRRLADKGNSPVIGFDEALSDEEGDEPGTSRMADHKLLDRVSGAAARANRATPSMIPRSVPAASKASNDSATRVSALARHFEQLSREFEKERLRERRMRAARMRQNRISHLPTTGPKLEVFQDASEAVNSRPVEPQDAKEARSVGRRTRSAHHRSMSDTPAYNSRSQSQEASELTDAEQTDQFTDNDRASTSLSHAASDTEVEGDVTDNDFISEGRQSRYLEPGTVGPSTTLMSPILIPDLELPLPKHEKSSLMKMLSSFWSERSASGWAPLEYPLFQTEHVFDDSDIVVREDEPSSVIALALSSEDYLKKVREFRQGGRSRSTIGGLSSVDVEAAEQAAIEASLVSETGTHMKYSFGHNQVRAQCKIFYAESFDALRRKCGVSERFVESLSRSIKWDSKGGKTKSLFLKTLDDRFVIKSLQEVEVKAFVRFAPDYFAFMSHTLFHGVPSVIAKMFGLFQVMIKNPATGVEFSSFLLVMENLFYDHKPSRRFDLKGSMRNRKIESTGQPDEVLLDENLVETIFETPLFVREHARKLVKASVWNDTMWLCKQNVMDYSLMAGFDDGRRELFVGIIDCIRTYTWDKKLESWIKDRGKNKPTITSPRDYRNRFRVSMMQYVLQAPNVYHDFSRAVVGANYRVRKAEEGGGLIAVDEAVGARKRAGGGVPGLGVQDEGALDDGVLREMESAAL